MHKHIAMTMEQAIKDAAKTAGRNVHCLALVLTYALRRPALPPARFVIFGRGRTGSTTLLSLLSGLPGVHCDGEVLKYPLLWPRLTVDALAARSGAPCYGCKILSYQVSGVQPLRHRQGFIADLHGGGYKILYLSRRNLLRHALSNIRARRYGFHRRRDADVALPTGAMTVEPEEVLRWMESSKSQEAFEKAVLDGVPHLPIIYEEHLEDEAAHQATVDRICGFLGIETAPVQSAYRRISPQRLEDLVLNTRQLVAYLQGTLYRDYVVDERWLKSQAE